MALASFATRTADGATISSLLRSEPGWYAQKVADVDPITHLLQVAVDTATLEFIENCQIARAAVPTSANHDSQIADSHDLRRHLVHADSPVRKMLDIVWPQKRTVSEMRRRGVELAMRALDDAATCGDVVPYATTTPAILGEIVDAGPQIVGRLLQFTDYIATPVGARVVHADRDRYKTAPGNIITDADTRDDVPHIASMPAELRSLIQTQTNLIVDRRGTVSFRLPEDAVIESAELLHLIRHHVRGRLAEYHIDA